MTFNDLEMTLDDLETFKILQRVFLSSDWCTHTFLYLYQFRFYDQISILWIFMYFECSEIWVFVQKCHFTALFCPNSLNFGPKCINVYIRRFVSSRRIDWCHFYSNTPYVAPSICRKPTFKNVTINFTSMNSRFNNPLNIKNNT